MISFLSKKFSLDPTRTIWFYILADGNRYDSNPPTFRSDSNTATLRFTSDGSRTETGILMAYVLGE